MTAAPVHVSTGSLPDGEAVLRRLAEAHRRFAGVREGEVSARYPALARADAAWFGIAVASVAGAVHAVGDAARPFTLMSVSKPFVFALVCDRLGPDAARERIGVNPTGLPFDSVEAVRRDPAGRTNPMVNAGAIAATSLAGGWEAIHDGLSRFAGRGLELDEEMYASASATNHGNRELAAELAAREALGDAPDAAVDDYTRQCSLRLTARDLAIMGATLADGGVNPVTGVRVVSARTCHHVLAVMAVAGLYEHSGDWLYDVGQPGKSGISGALVTVAPGKGALATFSPPLDAVGNSVRGRLAAAFLASALGLDLLASAPAGR